MKYYILILMIVLVGCKVSQSTKTDQSSITIKHQDSLRNIALKDSFQYLKDSIIAKKTNYIGKSLNDLIKDLPYTVESYMGGTSTHRYISPSITLSFQSRQNTSKAILQGPMRPILITVIWEKPLPIAKGDTLYYNGKGAWLEADKEYYGKQIIGDLVLSDSRYRK